MYSAGQNQYVMDYVYMPADTENFKNAHVNFKIVKENLSLTVTVQEPIGNTDLEGLLKGLQRDFLTKIKINLVTDCEVYLNVDTGLQSDLYKVIFNSNQISIEELVLEG